MRRAYIIYEKENKLDLFNVFNPSYRIVQVVMNNDDADEIVHILNTLEGDRFYYKEVIINDEVNNVS